MAEDEAIFDPSLKKKKKKKKTPFDLDAALGGEPAPESTETAAVEEPTVNEEPEAQPAEVVSLDDEFGGKKKKKKKKPLDLDDLGDALPDNETTAQDTNTDDVMALITDDDPFAFNAKKKKKKRKEVNFVDQDLDFGDDLKADDGGSSSTTTSKWANTDRDYTYDELLTRVFDIMREKNPEMVAGEKKRFVTKPPQVMKAGAKKTSFANFADICKLLHRQPKHLLNFLLTELGTSGSLDSMNQLIIKGRFQQKQIESVLRSYIKEYVTCHTCRSPDTILQKDTRLYFLQCESCGSRCSVASIKSGFQAVTGKRAAMRAKSAA